MKNKAIVFLAIVTAAALAFLSGLYVGRSSTHSPIQLAAVNQGTSASAAAYAAFTQAAAETQAVTEAPTEAATEAPTKTAEAPAETAAPTESARININTATAEELQALSGIGPVLSQRIVEYRVAHGAFASIEEICNVSGIGEVTFQKIADYITVGG
ncbi:MAG: helix-hairpin-helix domain-containing protein [Firmicutes bacterium]|nr:helix-hairpin-helix domain-containing protein [Bacillota bacterium]